jgi:hypothetical protein
VKKKIIAILISASMRVESIRMGVARKKQQQQQKQKAKHVAGICIFKVYMYYDEFKVIF